MGRAEIVSHTGRGSYKAKILKDIRRISTAKKQCEAGINAAVSAQSQAELEESAVKKVVMAIEEEIDSAIAAANGDPTGATIKSLQQKLTDASNTLEATQHAVAQAKLKRLAYEKKLDAYSSVVGVEERILWCADDTEDLEPGVEVGTIEVNQETTTMLVAPGGAMANSILQPGMANDPLATYLNWAILPGVQRWKPTYRVGTIKEIDYDADTCMVCLDDARSSAQNIKINKPGTECETQKDGPEGFVEFCERNPEHIACKSNGSTRLPYSANLNDLLTKINVEINGSNTYEYDSDKYGKLENWAEMGQSGDSGDCEDFALAKYRACLNAGIPASALKLATGRMSNGDGHAWLEVQTDQGNIALDLNTQAATFSDELPYSNRAVQADGTNWSGKGLLIEDVPIRYMLCNSGAFSEDDRVVVYFEESNWENPVVIGFEDNPKNCGLYVIYKHDGAYKAKSLVIGKETIKAKDDKSIFSSKFNGIFGTVPHFYKQARIKIRVADSDIYTMQYRDIAFVGIPFFDNGNGYAYRGDPCSYPSTTNTRFFVYAVDLKTKTKVMVFENYTQIGICNTPITTPGATKGFGGPHLSSWNHSDTHVFFARRQESNYCNILCSAFSFSISNNRISIDIGIERTISREETATEGESFVINKYGYVIYREGVATSNIIKTKKMHIISGITEEISKYDYMDFPDGQPYQWPHMFYQVYSGGLGGFDVKDLILEYSYVDHKSYNKFLTSDGKTVYGPSTYFFFAWTDIMYEAGGALTFGPSKSPLFSFYKDGVDEGDGRKFDIMLSFPDVVSNMFTITVPYAQTYLRKPLRLDEYGYFFPMSNIITDRINIQHVSYVGYGDGITETYGTPFVKNCYIFINEKDETNQVAAAVGCSRRDIVGVMYIHGL